MVIRFTVLVALAVTTAGLAWAEDKKDTSTKVTGSVIVPKDVPSFEGRVLELRLYASVKNAAERKAELVEKVEIKDFAHTEGAETKKDFTIGAKGELKDNTRYYITAFVLKRDDRTHIGEADHAKGLLNQVLTDGNPREITIRIKEIGKK
jgi:U3 small nucleolar RNA-associated protein 14